MKTQEWQKGTVEVSEILFSIVLGTSCDFNVLLAYCNKTFNEVILET